MRTQHVIVIVLAMIAVVFCGYHHECTLQMQTVGDIAKMIIAGALGNAMGQQNVAVNAVAQSGSTPKQGDQR